MAVAFEVVRLIDLLELGCSLAARHFDLEVFDVNADGFLGEDAQPAIAFPLGARHFFGWREAAAIGRQVAVHVLLTPCLGPGRHSTADVSGIGFGLLC